ncbi:putative signal peptide protein [Puccinia sorghi]|uniref:Putative signal peptide protein n=1 Tax=Puccinia sorghi TaxID=27349 RepID=A0A0L6V3T8_9BASI|nr:putative signal peptide protein [Puccinia sorghi]
MAIFFFSFCLPQLMNHSDSAAVARKHGPGGVLTIRSHVGAPDTLQIRCLEYVVGRYHVPQVFVEACPTS